MSGLILLTVVLLWAERCARGFVPNICMKVQPDRRCFARCNRTGALEPHLVLPFPLSASNNELATEED